MEQVAILRRLQNDFVSSRRGSAVVEFAFLAPAVVVFMMSGVLAFDAARSLRQMATAAATISDLSTRVEVMEDGRRDAMFATADALLGHYADTSSYNITITSVANQSTDDEDTLEAVWSVSKTPGEELTTQSLSGYSFPEIPDGESVILVTLDLDYTPPFKVAGMEGVVKLSDVSIRRPRFVSEVCYQNADETQDCSYNN